jgi:hypothetical protein
MLSLFKGFRARPALIYGAFAFLASNLVKIFPIIGSHCSFFSVVDAVMPLTGVVGIGMGILIALMRTGLTFAKISVSVMAPVYHLPGFFASASWAYPTQLMKVGVPVACMVLFVMHPCGLYAAPYVLYWFIPIAVYFSGKKTIFLQALSSTFIAHAVGSVIWLYAKALPTAVWLGLIPVVFFERLFYALLMTAMYYGVRDFLKIVRTRTGCAKVPLVMQKCFSNKNMS